MLVHRFDSVEEQLALQQGPPLADADGLEVLVSLRVADDRTTVIHRDADGGPWTSGWHGLVAAEPGRGHYAQIGSNPAVLAGDLPFGAATVELRVGRRPWIEPGALGRGFWLCVLDAPELMRTPELVYRDAEGVELEIEIPLDAAGVPALWPAQAPPPGPSSAFSPGHSYRLETDGWQVEPFHHGDILPLAQALLDTRTWLLAQELDVPDSGFASQPIVGSVLGRRHGFALAARHGVWAAVANCGRWAVSVKGTGAPPSRLDLQEVRQSGSNTSHSWSSESVPPILLNLPATEVPAENGRAAIHSLSMLGQLPPRAEAPVRTNHRHGSRRASRLAADRCRRHTTISRTSHAKNAQTGASVLPNRPRPSLPAGQTQL